MPNESEASFGVKISINFTLTMTYVWTSPKLIKVKQWNICAPSEFNEGRKRKFICKRSNEILRHWSAHSTAVELKITNESLFTSKFGLSKVRALEWNSDRVRTSYFSFRIGITYRTLEVILSELQWWFTSRWQRSCVREMGPKRGCCWKLLKFGFFFLRNTSSFCSVSAQKDDLSTFDCILNPVD